MLINAYQTTYFRRNPDLTVPEERTIVAQVCNCETHAAADKSPLLCQRFY